jgi:hypothetical protein
MSLSLPNVKYSSSDGLEKMRDENNSNYFKPLGKKTKKILQKKLCVLGYVRLSIPMG